MTSGSFIAPDTAMGRGILNRLEPLQSGRATEIDMIEREMEGGVVIIQPAEVEVHEHHAEERLGGLAVVQEDVDVRELGTKPSAAPKG
jgi:hypothetical protein